MTPEESAEIREMCLKAKRQQITWNEADMIAHVAIKALDALEAAEERIADLGDFCREAQILATEIVWGGKPGAAITPENIYTAGIGGIHQAFDMLKAERDAFKITVEQQAGEIERAHEALKILYVELSRLSAVAQRPLAGDER